MQPSAGPEAGGIALFTDLYELTMLQAYLEEGMTDTAVFSLSVRRLPARRGFLLSCGLDAVLRHLETLRFTDGDLAYLDALGLFSGRFLDWLRAFRFTGRVRAAPEGTPLFAREPILEVEAPLPEAQLIETFVLSQVQLQTLLATKAWRIVAAAAGRPVVDFGARRMHGIDAAVKGARAFAVAGAASTSNLLAGSRYGLPVAGTMAHSYVQAHDDEEEAFAAFARLYPDTVILVDTYDTLDAVRKVAKLARTRGEAFRIRAIRLDSGDLLALSRGARALLDEAGLRHVEIVASGGLDEDRIAALVAAGAPIDGFGVGTSMGVSEDAPSLDIAYKLCEYAGQGRLKLSAGKPVLPGRKQIFRLSQSGRDVGDVIARDGEHLDGRPLLAPVMQGGERLPAGRADLAAARARAQEEIARLPPSVRALDPPAAAYPVAVSPALALLDRQVKADIAARAGR